jgi:hypothetical protein
MNFARWLKNKRPPMKK